jgi:hypothetical protein
MAPLLDPGLLRLISSSIFGSSVSMLNFSQPCLTLMFASVSRSCSTLVIFKKIVLIRIKIVSMSSG